MFFFYFLFHFAVVSLPPQGDGKHQQAVNVYLFVRCIFTPARGRKEYMIQYARDNNLVVSLPPQGDGKPSVPSFGINWYKVVSLPPQGDGKPPQYTRPESRCCIFTPARGRNYFLRKQYALTFQVVSLPPQGDGILSSPPTPALERCIFTPARDGRAGNRWSATGYKRCIFTPARGRKVSLCIPHLYNVLVTSLPRKGAKTPAAS